MSGYDIIGDIHGCGEKLNGLLDLLGWEAGADGLRRHPSPTRKVIFVGDLIDRGTAQQQVLETVRSMVDAGTARIVMGNHEFNVISYATEIPGRPGHFLPEHSDKNYQQHKAFLEHLTEAEQARWVECFKTLPMWLDLEDAIGRIRIVHACWHQDSIDVLERELGGSLLPEGFADLAVERRPMTRALTWYRVARTQRPSTRRSRAPHANPAATGPLPTVGSERGLDWTGTSFWLNVLSHSQYRRGDLNPCHDPSTASTQRVCARQRPRRSSTRSVESTDSTAWVCFRDHSVTNIHRQSDRPAVTTAGGRAGATMG